MRKFVYLGVALIFATTLQAQIMQQAIVNIPKPAGASTVSFEAVTATPGTGTFNLSTSSSITLGGASSTRAVMIGLSFNVNTVSAVTVTVGGQSASLVSGTDTGAGASGIRTMIYCIATTLTGSQTVAASWTTDSGVALGAISATGVDQTTPCNNGTDTIVSTSLSVTSNTGDLTSTVSGETSGTATTNQTQKWNGTYSGVSTSQDIGPGTGTTTHTWSGGVGTLTISGANFKHA